MTASQLADTKMKESVLQKQVIEWLRSIGAYVVNIHGSPMQERGIPDLLICYLGHFVGMELKVPGKEPDDYQEYHLERIVAAGGVGCSVTTLDEAKKIIRSIAAQEDYDED